MIAISTPSGLGKRAACFDVLGVLQIAERWVQDHRVVAQAKPLRIIVPFPPGGATDIAGRALQEPLQRILGMPVVIENRSGAGGSIGMAEVVRSTDDSTLGVAVYFDQVASSLPYISAGRPKAVAVSWYERLAVIPNVPTYAELGVPQANDPSWFGLVAPKSMPAAQIRRIQQAVAQALKEPSVRDRLAAQGLYASGTTSAEFTAQIEAEIAKMKRVAAYAKIKLD